MNAHTAAQLELKKSGYHFLRHGKNHDIYFNPELRTMIPLKRHDFNENDLQYIQKEIKHNKGGKE